MIIGPEPKNYYFWDFEIAKPTSNEAQYSFTLAYQDYVFQHETNALWIHFLALYKILRPCSNQQLVETYKGAPLTKICCRPLPRKIDYLNNIKNDSNLKENITSWWDNPHKMAMTNRMTVDGSWLLMITLF